MSPRRDGSRLSGPGPFEGFGEDLVPFFEGLTADNSKAYWQDRTRTYERAVRDPMLALLAALEPEFGPGRMFRPYRDVRFSTDKSPYKTHAAGLVGGMSGGLYVQVSADGLMVGAGTWQMASDQLERYRRAVLDDLPGAALERLATTLRASGADMAAHGALKRAPRGVPEDHPRIALLRLKGLTAGLAHDVEPWLFEPACREVVADAWRAFAPLNRWLATNVGESALPRR